MIDAKKVTAAVKIRIAMDRAIKTSDRLYKDLARLEARMTPEEFNEYQKRIA